MDKIETAKVAIDELITSLEPGTEISTEGLEVVTNFFQTLSGSIKTLLTDESAGLVRLKTPDIKKRKTEKKLKSLGFSRIEDLTVTMPEGVITSMPKYLDILERSLNELDDVKGRLLEPLLHWVGKAVQDPLNYIPLNWLDDNVKFSKINKVRKEWAKVYTDKYGDSLGSVPLYKAYNSNKAIIESGERLTGLVKLCNKTLETNIIELVNEISDHVNTLVANKNDLTHMPKGTLKELSNVMYNTAEELEFLSLLSFHIKTSSFAYEQMLEEIGRV